MKIAIIGAGAMGSLFGAMLAEGGHGVWLNDIWAEHVSAINATGLEIDHQGQQRNVRLKATQDPHQVGSADLVIIFVKSTHTPKVAPIAKMLCGDNGAVITLQNGMGNADMLAREMDPSQILAGTTSHGATLLGPGRIRHAGAGATTIGPWAQTEMGFKRADRIAELFNQAGIETRMVEDVRTIIWNKLLINIGINAITALTGIKNGQILDLEATQDLSRTAVEEAMTVARAHEIPVSENTVETVFQVAQATSANRSSMGQDVDNQRATEIGAINGFIVAEARLLGIPVPVNQTLTALVETMENSFSTPSKSR
jgi:2-dehydropantoate 2-reductase